MINKNLKLNTLYINKHSKQTTYFFIRFRNAVYGARKEDSTDWKWHFGTWTSYSLNGSEYEGKLSKKELIDLKRKAIIDLTDGDGATDLLKYSRGN